jgi:hypothetical protein
MPRAAFQICLYWDLQLDGRTSADVKVQDWSGPPVPQLRRGELPLSVGG